MKIQIYLPDDGGLTLSGRIVGEERPTQEQSRALRDLVQLAGFLRAELLPKA